VFLPLYRTHAIFCPILDGGAATAYLLAQP